MGLEKAMDGELHQQLVARDFSPPPRDTEVARGIFNRDTDTANGSPGKPLMPPAAMTLLPHPQTWSR